MYRTEVLIYNKTQTKTKTQICLFLLLPTILMAVLSQNLRSGWFANMARTAAAAQVALEVAVNHLGLKIELRIRKNHSARFVLTQGSQSLNILDIGCAINRAQRALLFALICCRWNAAIAIRKATRQSIVPYYLHDAHRHPSILVVKFLAQIATIPGA